MTDLSITAANVAASTAAQRGRGTAGEAINAGQTVYRKASDQKIYLSDADDTAADECLGVALNTAEGANQPVEWAEQDPDFNPGATVTVGEIYVVSGTAGGIAPVGDLANPDRAIVVGVGKTASTMNLAVVEGGIVPA